MTDEERKRKLLAKVEELEAANAKPDDGQETALNLCALNALRRVYVENEDRWKNVRIIVTATCVDSLGHPLIDSAMLTTAETAKLIDSLFNTSKGTNDEE